MAAKTGFEGFSRTKYEYELADPANLAALPMQAGNYIFARRVAGAPDIVFAGETESLRATLANHPRWREAQARHQAQFIYYHLNPVAGRRRLELHDLVRRHAPPMNPPPRVEED